MTASTLAVGQRVLVTNGYSKGELGTITNTPGKVFNGWTVKLDNGRIFGAGEWELRVDRTRPWVLTMQSSNGTIYRMGRFGSEAAAEWAADSWNNLFPSLTRKIVNKPVKRQRVGGTAA